MTTTNISISSTASLLIGGDEIVALPGTTRESQVCFSVIDNTIFSILSCYPWKFAKAQASLNKLTSTPLFKEFKNAFQKPADLQRVIRVQNNHDYLVHQNFIYSNANQLELEYIRIPSISEYPSYVVRVIELKLAAYLALAVAEDTKKHKLYSELFDKELEMAKAVDSQDQPSGRIRANAFINARFSGYDEEY